MKWLRCVCCAGTLALGLVGCKKNPPPYQRLPLLETTGAMMEPVISHQTSPDEVKLESSVPLKVVRGTKAVFVGQASGDVVEVELYVDNYAIGKSAVTNQKFSISYVFNSIGDNRRLELAGYSAKGEKIASKFYVLSVRGSSDKRALAQE